MATHLCSIEYDPGNYPGKKFFRASKTLYTSTNAADTGITPEDGATASLTPLLDTGELMRAGFLERINVYVKTGTDRQQTVRMFCIPTKKASLMAKYNGSSPGTLNGKAITGASSGTRRATYRL